MLADIGEIKLLRKKHGLTQKQLAGLAGVSQSLIAKTEAGLIDASYSKIRGIFEALHALGKEKETKAKDVISGNIISVKSEEQLAEAISKMKRYSISQLPVVEKGYIVGLISEGDIIEALHKGKDIGKATVEDAMQETPPTVPPETPLSIVTELLRLRQMVVVMDKGKPKGVITKADVLKNLGRL